MSIAKYIKEIGRGKEGARSLSADDAYDLMGQVLDRQGIEVGPHDQVAPDLSSRLTDGTSIAVQYGRQVTVTVDGSPQTFYRVGEHQATGGHTSSARVGIASISSRV